MDLIYDVLVSVLSVVITGYILYRVKIESRLKDMENDLKLLAPIKDVLLKKGSEHVTKVFEEHKK
jgi:hypothetical protein